MSEVETSSASNLSVAEVYGAFMVAFAKKAVPHCRVPASAQSAKRTRVDLPEIADHSQETLEHHNCQIAHRNADLSKALLDLLQKKNYKVYQPGETKPFVLRIPALEVVEGKPTGTYLASAKLLNRRSDGYTDLEVEGELSGVKSVTEMYEDFARVFIGKMPNCEIVGPLDDGRR